MKLAQICKTFDKNIWPELCSWTIKIKFPESQTLFCHARCHCVSTLSRIHSKATIAHCLLLIIIISFNHIYIYFFPLGKIVVTPDVTGAIFELVISTHDLLDCDLNFDWATVWLFLHFSSHCSLVKKMPVIYCPSGFFCALLHPYFLLSVHFLWQSDVTTWPRLSLCCLCHSLIFSKSAFKPCMFSFSSQKPLKTKSRIGLLRITEEVLHLAVY